MKTGFDPRLNRMLTVEEHQRLYDSNLLSRIRRTRPQVVCPGCESPLRPADRPVAAADMVWEHKTAAGVICPIEDSDAIKYELQTPPSPDPKVAAALRKAFFINWKKHWGEVRRNAAHAEIEILIDFIKHADRVDVWGQAGLCEWHLPYICLVTCELAPAVGKASANRGEFLRFRFDNKIRELPDLWNQTIPGLRFLTLRYRWVRSGAPTTRHLIDCAPSTPSDSWMRRNFAKPHLHQVRAMHLAFPDELAL